MTETISFSIAGMTCASCVNRITRSLRQVDGVRRVKVDLRSERATVERDTRVVSNEQLAAAVIRAGYEPGLGSAVALADFPVAHRWLSSVFGRSHLSRGVRR